MRKGQRTHRAARHSSRPAASVSRKVCPLIIDPSICEEARGPQKSTGEWAFWCGGVDGAAVGTIKEVHAWRQGQHEPVFFSGCRFETSPPPLGSSQALPQRKYMIPVPAARIAFMSASEILLELAPGSLWSSFDAIVTTRTKYRGRWLTVGMPMISGSQVLLPKVALQGAVGATDGAIDGGRGVGACVGAWSGTSQYAPDQPNPAHASRTQEEIKQNAALAVCFVVPSQMHMMGLPGGSSQRSNLYCSPCLNRIEAEGALHTVSHTYRASNVEGAP